MKELKYHLGWGSDGGSISRCGRSGATGYILCWQIFKVLIKSARCVTCERIRQRKSRKESNV